MRATVIGVDPDAKQGTWDVTEFMYRGDNGKIISKKIFKNMPVNEAVLRLTPGQEVDIEFDVAEKGGKTFYNIKNVEVADGTAPAPQGEKVSHGPKATVDWDAKDANIRRAVCLKAAIELAAATATSKTDLAKLAEIAVEIAPIFEPYLKGETVDPFEE